MEQTAEAPGDKSVDDNEPADATSASERWALVAFAVAVAVAFPVIMYLGRDQWFFLDEWAFLADRDGGSADGLLRPHNEHWVTLPVIAYRTLHRVFGLTAYWPYQAVAVALHLTAAVLLRVVMRRAGVVPWVATAASVLFVFLGAGRTNISYAFQMQFTGALVAGLIQLLLATRKDRTSFVDRWDGVGVGFGLLALMCSSVGVATAVAAGAAALIGRGWRAAAVHSIPLGVAYLAWYAAYGSEGVKDDATASAPDALEFAAEVVANGFHAMGQIPGVGVVLGAFAVWGVVIAIRGLPESRALAAAPVGLAVAGVVLMGIVGYGRAALPGSFSNPEEPRYLYLVVAFALPLVAYGASWLAERAAWAQVAVVVVLLAGLPGNFGKLEPEGAERLTLGAPDLIAELADQAVERRPPRDLHPLPGTAPEITVGWLIDERSAGRIDPPGSVNARVRGTATLAVSLRQISGPRPRPCRPAPAFFASRLTRGQVLTVARPSSLVVVDEATGGRVSYVPDGRSDDPVFVRVEAAALRAVVGSSTRGQRAQVCG